MSATNMVYNIFLLAVLVATIVVALTAVVFANRIVGLDRRGNFIREVSKCLDSACFGLLMNLVNLWLCQCCGIPWLAFVAWTSFANAFLWGLYIKKEDV